MTFRKVKRFSKIYFWAWIYMKKIIIIFFSSIILFTTMSNGVIFLMFKIKQAEIVEKLCINRNQPSKHCEGKCFLKDRFEEKNNDNGKNTPLSNVEESLKINLISSLFFESLSKTGQKELKPNFIVNPFTFQSFCHSLLDPPQFSTLSV